MVARRFFALFVALVAGQRLAEMRVSRRNEIKMLEAGGCEHGSSNFRFMKAMHASWLVAMLVEVFYLKRPFVPAISGFALLLTAAGQILRYLAILTLGSRWSVKVITLPGAPLVKDGIYRYLRHPNYLGVILEIFAVPLVHSAYLTSIGFSLLNAAVLRTRIRIEENALREG